MTPPMLAAWETAANVSLIGTVAFAFGALITLALTRPVPIAVALHWAALVCLLPVAGAAMWFTVGRPGLIDVAGSSRAGDATLSLSDGSVDIEGRDRRHLRD